MVDILLYAYMLVGWYCLFFYNVNDKKNHLIPEVFNAFNGLLILLSELKLISASHGTFIWL